MNDTNTEPRNSRWARGLTISGIVIAILNMALAWAMMFSPAAPQFLNAGAPRETSRSGLHEPPPESGPTDAPRTLPWAPGQKKNQEVSPHQAWGELTNFMRIVIASSERETTLILGFCFALISIGFSLFVMGIEGAIGMRGQARDFGSLLVKTSSPGLFCILLASILVAMSLVSGGVQPITETESSGKVDILRAEADAKAQVIEAEAFAKERVMEAETYAKERVMEAETYARERLIEAETFAKQNLLESTAASKQRQSSLKPRVLNGKSEQKEEVR